MGESTSTESTVEIHEFSTGIRYQGTADGGWVSLGFTGQYMNATIDPIPYAVERSIANKEFAVAEGAFSDQPAVIGRVVRGNEEPDWSVIAIIARGKDEKARSASFYRYFLCAGGNHLQDILAGIENYKQQNGRMPVFDPLDEKVVKLPNDSNGVPTYKTEDLTPEDKSWTEDETANLPLLITVKRKYSLEQINELATAKSQHNSQPVAWAFNVEALEQPGRFQIIKAASDSAYKILKRAKKNTPQNSVHIVADEQMIKTAIKALINSSTVRSEYIEALANSLENAHTAEQNTQFERYLIDIFDGQGAINALKQGVYSPQMVRLLMLRAIVIPQTLPEYLGWLEKGNKQNEPYTVAIEFESQLSKSLSKIPNTVKIIELSISKGFEILLFSLLAQKVSSKTVNKLLDSDDRIWRKFSRQFISCLEHDLELMKQFSSGQSGLNFRLTDTSWQKNWKDWQIYWRDCAHPHFEKYQPLAELFYNLKKPNLSVFFGHLGYGQIPKKIFYQLQYNGFNTEVYGVEVQRKVTVTELLWLTIITLGGKKMPVAIVIPTILLSLLFAFVGGFKFGESSSQKTNISQGFPTVATTSSTAKEGWADDGISSGQFDNTREAIKQVVKELSLGTPENKPEVEEQIKKVLMDYKLDFQFLHNDSNKEWKDAIENYKKIQIQRNKYNDIKDNIPEILISKNLKCDVATSLNPEPIKDCKKNAKAPHNNGENTK